MQKYSEMSKEQLQALKKELDQQYAEIKAQGLAPAVLTYMLATELKEFDGHVDSQEIGLPVTSNGLVLPCGASGRWEAK